MESLHYVATSMIVPNQLAKESRTDDEFSENRSLLLQLSVLIKIYYYIY